MSNNQQPITINQIGIIGSGVMGAGIAQLAATSGCQVIVYDNSQTALEKTKINLENALKKLVEKQKITEQTAREIFERIQFSSDLIQFKNCRLVIEAVVENLEVKQKLLSELESIVSATCLLASNTSSLSIASIASVCKNPERVIGIHFFNPAPIMPLVEIVPAITTDSKVTEEAKKIIDLWGKVTVLAKDTPGFIVNRVVRSYYGESIRIYEEGMADFSTIDWAMKTFGAFKMGPFELMDFIGIDINYKVTENVWEQFFYEPRFKPSLTQKRLFEAKWFGRKSMRGFYNYAETVSIPEPNQDEILGKYIFKRVLVMLINEAIEALYMKVANTEEIDLAITKGVNYPKGLLKWADDLGLPHVLDTLNDLYLEYAEERYRPSVLLKQMVREGKTFY